MAASTPEELIRALGKAANAHTAAIVATTVEGASGEDIAKIQLSIALEHAALVAVALGLDDGAAEALRDRMGRIRSDGEALGVVG